MDSKSKLKLLNSLKDCVETLSKVAAELEVPKTIETESSKYVNLTELKKIAGIA